MSDSPYSRRCSYSQSERIDQCLLLHHHRTHDQYNKKIWAGTGLVTR